MCVCVCVRVCVCVLMNWIFLHTKAETCNATSVIYRAHSFVLGTAVINNNRKNSTAVHSGYLSVPRYPASVSKKLIRSTTVSLRTCITHAACKYRSSLTLSLSLSLSAPPSLPPSLAGSWAGTGRRPVDGLRKLGLDEDTRILQSSPELEEEAKAR